MKRVIFLIIIIVGTAFSTASATIINVPGDHATIQGAINASTNGDTILVQPGTYIENINFNGHNVLLGSLLLTTSDVSYVSSTIIDGSNSGAVLTFNSGENSSAQVLGFTIQNGSAGVSCSGASPMISHNSISGLTSKGSSGILLVNSSATILNNSIFNNWAGISTSFSDATIIGNSITGNSGGAGSGLKASLSSLIVESNIFANNSSSNVISASSGDGGAIACSENDLTIMRFNVFCNNTSNAHGGAIDCRNTKLILVNNTFAGNSADIRGGAIRIHGTSDVTIENTIMWGNTAPVSPSISHDAGALAITYSDIEGGCPGEGNQNIDPLFRDPDNCDLHLMAIDCGDPFNSLLIDAGSPDLTDRILGCELGLGTCRSDMGAFGGADPGLTCAGNALQFDGTDRVQIPHDVSLSFPVGANFTVELWMNPSDTSGIKHFLGKRVAAPTQCEGVEYQLALDDNNPTSLHLSTSPSNLNIRLSSNSLVIPDTWLHVAVTYDGTTLRMYLDGVLNASRVAPFGQPNLADLTIGTSSNCGNSFVGLIDEVRIWDVTRSAGEIALFYNQTVSPSAPGLVGYWNFDEDFLDQNVFDVSPLNNDGTLGFDLLESSNDPIRVTSTAPFSCLITCNTAPVAVCQDITIAAGENCTADASIDDGSNDPDGDPITITQEPAGPYPIGTTLVSLTVTDDNGSSSTCEATVTVTEGQGNIAGNVSTSCNGSSGFELSVPIDVFDSLGTLVASTITAPDGSFEISGLPSGQIYTVSIIPALGFSADFDEKVAEVICGNTTIVDFILTCVEISSNPRASGFWRHQLGVALGGNGQGQVDAATLCGYLDMIEGHFNTNEINQVIVYNPPASGVCADKLQVAKDLLNLKGRQSMTSRAKQQLTTLLMNVAAGYISQTEIISADGSTVSQAITYCDNLIDDTNGDHEKAKSTCFDINNSIQVAAGVIPLSTVNIAYRNVIRPDEFALLQNYPNPFNPSTNISFSLPDAAEVTLEIYNVLGQKIVTLVNAYYEAGEHVVQWDGRDAVGSSVSSGIYFYRLTAGTAVTSKKMMLLK